MLLLYKNIILLAVIRGIFSLYPTKKCMAEGKIWIFFLISYKSSISVNQQIL